MEIRKTTTVDVPIEKVWKIAAHDFDQVGAWASAVGRSQPNDQAAMPQGAEVGGRVCSTAFGDTQENFTRFDPEGHSFSYRAEGLPAMIKRAENRWSLRSTGPSRTEVTTQVTMELNAFPGRLMQPLMRRRLAKTLDQILEELKHFMETGSIHPRKVQAQERVAARVGGAVTS